MATLEAWSTRADYNVHSLLTGHSAVDLKAPYCSKCESERARRRAEAKPRYHVNVADRAGEQWVALETTDRALALRLADKYAAQWGAAFVWDAQRDTTVSECDEEE